MFWIYWCYNEFIQSLFLYILLLFSLGKCWVTHAWNAHEEMQIPTALLVRAAMTASSFAFNFTHSLLRHLSPAMRACQTFSGVNYISRYPSYKKILSVIFLPLSPLVCFTCHSIFFSVIHRVLLTSVCIGCE